MSRPILIAGLPGNMAIAVANACLDRKFELVPYSLTGPLNTLEEFDFEETKILPLNSSERTDKIKAILEDYPNLIAVDYTHPDAVNENAKFYVENKIPFVMGTTGGDRDALTELVKKANHPCIIAPNMAKQIVAFQAMMEYMATNFPGVFDDYFLRIIESHQSTKADTSGTAKSLVGNFANMGVILSSPTVTMIRDKDKQRAMGIPEEYLSGHAYHTYRITGPDGSVIFEFTHNVLGRKIYAEGTADAIEFLARKLNTNQITEFPFSMIDVLKG